MKGLGRPSSNSAMTLHGGSLVERELDLPVVLGRRVIAESPLCHSREGGNTVGASGDELDPRLCGDDVEWVGKAEFQLGHGVARRFAGRAGARPSCGAESSNHYPVIPAQAGIQREYQTAQWIPAYEGMT